jgi:hypothetical protein
VNANAPISFATNGPITSGITHAPSSSNIIINSTGVYKVIFSVTTQDSSQFSLFLNGVALPDSIYGTGGPLVGPPGQVILLANAGDVLTLHNFLSISVAVSLPASAGGSQINVNASITIIQLA